MQPPKTLAEWAERRDRGALLLLGKRIGLAHPLNIYRYARGERKPAEKFLRKLSKATGIPQKNLAA